jgi:hypothetical protein
MESIVAEVSPKTCIRRRQILMEHFFYISLLLYAHNGVLLTCEQRNILSKDALFVYTGRRTLSAVRSIFYFKEGRTRAVWERRAAGSIFHPVILGEE